MKKLSRIRCRAMLSSAPLPPEVRTARLLLRRQRPEYAMLVKEAVDASLTHLKASVAWAQSAPFPLPTLEALLAGAVTTFDAGAGWAFSIFDHAVTRVLGA